uniref:Uncharacterized protein n=1 Tax=Agrobacterium albertimagni TaxID=147266 RepID=A0A7C1PDL4_9HYPH
MIMIREMVTRWLTHMRKPKRDTASKEHRQVALPLRADLPLRERSRSLVAVPAQINGARMGSGKF